MKWILHVMRRGVRKIKLQTDEKVTNPSKESHVLIKRSLSVFWIGLFVLLKPVSLTGQDAHYWSQQFGNRARLLGGSVIGSVEDISAVYYNPGALPLVESPELLLAGRVIEISRFAVQSTENLEFKGDYTRFDFAPSLFAGEIKLGEDNRDRFGYSFLTRYNSEFRIRSKIQSLGFDLELPAVDVLANDFFGELYLREYWVGGTWARKLGEGSGFGVSAYFAYRSHRAKLNNTTQALLMDGTAAIALITNDYRYSHLRLLGKLGFATVIEKWQVGINLTTPGIGLWSSAERGLDRSVVGQFPDEEGNLLTEISTFFQETEADYRSPWSIGFGAARRFGNTKLHLSGEWFAFVSAYQIIDTDPFESQSSGELIETTVVQALKSTFNVGFGVEHKLREDLQFYGAFSTDFNSADKEGGDGAAFGEFDLYHLSGGATFMVGTSELTVGGTLSLSNAKTLRTAEEDPLPAELELTYMSFSAIFGFQLPF